MNGMWRVLRDYGWDNVRILMGAAGICITFCLLVTLSARICMQAHVFARKRNVVCVCKRKHLHVKRHVFVCKRHAFACERHVFVMSLLARAA